MANPFDQFMARKQSYGPTSGGGISPWARAAGDAATGILGAVEADVQQQKQWAREDAVEQRKWDRQMTLEEWKIEKQKELADYENAMKMEFEKNKRTWDREDMIAKYEFEWSKFTSEKDYEAAIAEAKAQGDHERALALAKAKEQFKAEFNPSDSDAKGKREDIGRYREAALVEFTSSLFPEGMSTMDPRTGEAIDVEKMGIKSYINILKQSDNPQDRAKADVLAETNRKAQNAKTPEDIDRIFAEQRAKLEDTDPLGIR